ncbi:MAG: 4-alpha-glucanotransferase [Acetobacteraceae bacterium]
MAITAIRPAGYGDSPYQPLSTFAGNELLVSPEDLIEDGLLRSDDCAGGSFCTTAVDYAAVIPFKRRLFETTWSNFTAGGRADLRNAFSEFCEREAHWLDDYALFRALKARIRGASYLDWPADLARREAAALDSARRELFAECELTGFAQFLLFRQGGSLKEYGRAKGLRMLGDLPFYVSPDSSDVWANPQLFRLDEHDRPLFVAGVPPDYFSATGQLWGNPVYNWQALRDTGYRWWIDRLRPARACRHDTPGSLPRFRRGLARTRRIGDGRDRKLGSRSGHRFLRCRGSGAGRTPIHRAGSGTDHARCGRIARPLPSPGDARAPVRLRRPRR